MVSAVFFDDEEWQMVSSLRKMTGGRLLATAFYNPQVVISANGWLLVSFNNDLTYEFSTEIAIKCYLGSRAEIYDFS